MPETVEFLRERLKVHRLEYDDVQPKDLVVPEGETFVLAAEDPNMPGAQWVPDMGCKVEIESLEDLKLWMGIPDVDARKMRPRRRRGVIRGPRIEVGPLIPTRRTNSMFEVAKSYLTGDSTLHAVNVDDLWEVVRIKPELWFPVAKDVTIEHNAMLVLNSTVNKFVAGNIYIKTGGQMRVQSALLKIECKSITGNLP